MAARTANAHDIVGRQRELADVETFLGQARSSAQALVIGGEAGIGKTRLWREAVERAQNQGFRILSSRPGGADVQLVFAGLADLLRDAPAEALDELPAPQRRALGVALMLESGRSPPDALAVAAAFLGVVRRLATASPVLLAVDDVQWFDASSAGVLEFALRRLASESVGVLMAVRRQPGRWAPPQLCEAVSEERLRWIDLEPLSVGAIFELVSARLGARLSRPALLRVHETSGGNAFYALELAQALEAAGTEPAPGAPLPVPGTLRELLAARLEKLSKSARESLLAASALTSPSVDAVGAAIGDEERVAQDLHEATRAGLVELNDGAVRFCHPLLASTTYAAATAAERRRLHRRLAEIASTREERARHLALATQEPHADVAAELDVAAAEARARGASGATAELLELAATLTPGGDRERGFRRRVAAADAAFAAGSAERAHALLDAALAEARPGADRAEVLLRLGEMVIGDDIGHAAELLCEAEQEAGTDQALRARILCALAKFRYGHWIGYDRSEACAGAAAELAEREGDRRTLALALALRAQRVFFRGGGLDEALMERAVRIEESEAGDALDVGEDSSAAMICAEALILGERLDPGRMLLERLCDRGRRAGDAGVSYPLHVLALLEFDAGRWDRAEAAARESVDLAVQSGRETIEVVAASALGIVEGALGRVSSARRGLEDALALAEKVGRGGRAPRYGLGLLALSLQDHAAAWTWLEPAIERILPLGMTEPSEQVSDGVEALAELGRVEEAAALLAAFEEPARRLCRRWSLAAAARNRGLLLAAEGDLDAAEGTLAEAVAIGEALPRPLELARSLLALGTAQRRNKRKQAARATLGRALALFEELGAPLWAERARREMGRIGGRIPYGHELSATEEQIAELVRRGQSNKQVAATLHLSVKTVEWNLSKIYRKLGVRSRTQLGADQSRGFPRL